MAFKINGSDIIGAGRQFTSTANVSVTDSIIIADNESLGAVSGSAAGYTFSDGTVAIGEDGLGLNDVTLQDASIVIAEPIVFQGAVSGYTSGGEVASLNYVNTIDKFPFAADANATDVGDLTVIRREAAGQSSEVSGYSSGGLGYGPSFIYYNVIDKFPFSTNGNASDVGDLTLTRFGAAGQSSKINGFGYTSGGSATLPPSARNTIDKFPFASAANATDVGDLTQAAYGVVGQSSEVSGYNAGGSTPAVVNTITKFPFATNANATDVGDLTQARYIIAGQSSKESGYTSGGLPPVTNTIDKFPFSTDTNATDVGDLTQARYGGAGQSSKESGYTSGGQAPGNVNTIDKFPFATDANATDVGDLTQSRSQAAGQQV